MSVVLYMMVLYECGNIMWYYMSVVISVSLRACGHACVESGSVCVRGRECLSQHVSNCECLSQHVSNCLCFTNFLRKIVRVCSSVLPVCMCVSPCVCVCACLCACVARCMRV